MAISQDDKLLATGSADKTCILWDFNTGQKLKELKGHLKEVLAVGIANNYDMGDQQPFEKI